MNIRTAGLTLIAVLALGGLGYTGQASAQHNNDRYDNRYDNRYDDRQEICGYCGTVRGISRVNRNGRRTGSIVVGALIGGLVGNQIGGGSGKKVATVAGAVAGGAIANNATKDDRRRTYYRIEVRMDDGRIQRFDQSNSNGLRNGERVEIQNGTVYRAH